MQPLSQGSFWLPGFDPAAPCGGDQSIEPDLDPVPQQAVVDRAVTSIETPRLVWRATEASGTDRSVRPLWRHLTREDLAGLSGPVAKFDANLAAIDVLQDLSAGGVPPTADQQTRLLRFTGWGGLPASFNENTEDPAWAQRSARLRRVLDDADHESALASVNTSHYTEVHVIETMWQALARLGFQGGRILEPSAGIGHFIGAMPRAVASASTVTAVEMDRLSGRILHALYAAAGVDVRICAFERAELPDQWFDLVIGNVPFGRFPAADMSSRPYARFGIHNYFIARSLDLVRPGGLVCLITSSHTMDATNDGVRDYLDSQGELLGAIRLPKGTFSGIGATEAQADMLFLRRRERGEVAEGPWVKLGKVPAVLRHPECHELYLSINAWYAAQPAFCIGLIRRESNGYTEVPTAVHDGDLETALRERIALLPQDVYSASAPKLVATRMARPAEVGARPGSYRMIQGRVHRVEKGELLDVHAHLNGTQRLRIAGMCAIRDQARALLEAQLSGAEDHRLAEMRSLLNASYDRYVARHGCVTARANAMAFRRDPDYPLLLSLEFFDEETQTATKAALFTRRTLARVAEPLSVAEPMEALAASMQWRGRVDAPYMASLLQTTEASVLQDLAQSGQIFEDPSDGLWRTADEYLSGNVRQKLQQALLSKGTCPGNVEALQRVQPEDLPPAAIEARLGAVWIPPHDVEGFIAEVLDLKDATVAYSASAGAWSLRHNAWTARQNVKVTQEFGTARMNAVELTLCALNVQVPTVRDLDPKTDRLVVNADETLAAREKLGLIKARFAEWAFEDLERRQRLCRLYNDLFNATRPRRFDGSALKLPGFSQCYTLHPHQPDAVWRIVQSGNTGLFHTVGAGKTAVCVIASMELKRLGFIHKACHVVPNHMLQAYTAEFVRLYPNASVLMASKEDLEGDHRRELVSRIATGDWDAVVITHASFERIRMSPLFSERFIKEAIREIAMAIRAERAGDRSNRIIKQLEAMKKNWTVRLERMGADKKKDDLLCWEELGIDQLFIDEAHCFKNLYRFTKMTRVAGLPLTSSERAFDMYLKTRYTMQIHGHAQRGVVFATATPVANTMAEIHTMMRYLQPDRLVQLGLQQFDAWAATFGESVTALEISPDGSGYRMHTRFARFINVPELMAVFGEVADIRTAEMLALPVPSLRGGKPRTVACPASAALKAYVRTLVQRAEAIRQGRVKPQADNMLAVTTDGRKAALDFRLVAEEVAFDPAGKVAACVREVLAVWQRTMAFRGAQLVFCDLSSPKGGKSFSVYEDLRDRLLSEGLAASEIEFIQDAETDTQKATLFRAVREGRIRVLIGSTAKMGVGTNVQDRLAALHHLDAPWRPCDVEQREGRILRQGNTCGEVEIFRYVTEGSFDSYSWQTLETKARFIAQVMKGDQGIRSLEDVELAALSYAEVKALASGNPLVLEKAGVDADVARLSTLYSVWRNQRYANESEVGHLPLVIASMERKVATLETDRSNIEPQSLHSLCLTLGNRTVTGLEAVGDALRVLVKEAIQEPRGTGRKLDRAVGRFGGLDMAICAGAEQEIPNLCLSGAHVYEARSAQTGPALVAALLAALELVNTSHAQAVEQLKVRRKRLEDIRLELSRPFEHEGRLRDLRERQRQLLKRLELDKGDAGSMRADADLERTAA